MATNVTVTVEGNEVVIRFDASKRLGASASGKSIKVASTDGNLDVAGVPGAEGLKVGVNAYIPVSGG